MATKKRIGEILIEAGVIDRFQLESALVHQRQWGGPLGRILVDNGFVDERRLVEGLSRQLNIPLLDLDGHDIHQKVIEQLPKDLAVDYRCVPVRVQFQPGRGPTIFLAMTDPTHIEAIDAVQFRTGKRVTPVISSESAIERAIRRYYFGEAPRQGQEGYGDAQFGGQEVELETPAAPSVRPALRSDTGVPLAALKAAPVDDEIPLVTGSIVNQTPPAGVAGLQLNLDAKPLTGFGPPNPANTPAAPEPFVASPPEPFVATPPGVFDGSSSDSGPLMNAPVEPAPLMAAPVDVAADVPKREPTQELELSLMDEIVEPNRVPTQSIGRPDGVPAASPAAIPPAAPASLPAPTPKQEDIGEIRFESVAGAASPGVTGEEIPTLPLDALSPVPDDEPPLAIGSFTDVELPHIDSDESVPAPATLDPALLTSVEDAAPAPLPTAAIADVEEAPAPPTLDPAMMTPVAAAAPPPADVQPAEAQAAPSEQNVPVEPPAHSAADAAVDPTPPPPASLVSPVAQAAGPNAPALSNTEPEGTDEFDVDLGAAFASETRNERVEDHADALNPFVDSDPGMPAAIPVDADAASLLAEPAIPPQTVQPQAIAPSTAPETTGAETVAAETVAAETSVAETSVAEIVAAETGAADTVDATPPAALPSPAPGAGGPPGTTPTGELPPLQAGRTESSPSLLAVDPFADSGPEPVAQAKGSILENDPFAQRHEADAAGGEAALSKSEMASLGLGTFAPPDSDAGSGGDPNDLLAAGIGTTPAAALDESAPALAEDNDDAAPNDDVAAPALATPPDSGMSDAMPDTMQTFASAFDDAFAPAPTPPKASNDALSAVDDTGAAEPPAPSPLADASPSAVAMPGAAMPDTGDALSALSPVDEIGAVTDDDDVPEPTSLPAADEFTDQPSTMPLPEDYDPDSGDGDAGGANADPANADPAPVSWGDAVSGSTAVAKLAPSPAAEAVAAGAVIASGGASFLEDETHGDNDLPIVDSDEFQSDEAPDLQDDIVTVSLDDAADSASSDERVPEMERGVSLGARVVPEGLVPALEMGTTAEPMGATVYPDGLPPIPPPLAPPAVASNVIHVDFMQHERPPRESTSTYADVDAPSVLRDGSACVLVRRATHFRTYVAQSSGVDSPAALVGGLPGASARAPVLDSGYSAVDSIQALSTRTYPVGIMADEGPVKVKVAAIEDWNSDTSALRAKIERSATFEERANDAAPEPITPYVPSGDAPAARSALPPWTAIAQARGSGTNVNSTQRMFAADIRAQVEAARAESAVTAETAEETVAAFAMPTTMPLSLAVAEAEHEPLPQPLPAPTALPAVDPTLPLATPAALDAAVPAAAPPVADDVEEANPFENVTPTSITRLTPDELRKLASRMIAKGAITTEDVAAAKDEDD